MIGGGKSWRLQHAVRLIARLRWGHQRGVGAVLVFVPRSALLVCVCVCVSRASGFLCFNAAEHVPCSTECQTPPAWLSRCMMRDAIISK